jgi:hypothetical protein
MTDRPQDKSPPPSASKADAPRRRERLAAALRANLARRKTQARERADADAGEPPSKQK